MCRVEHHENNIIVVVLSVVMYSAAIWWACTCEWLGPCIDGPKYKRTKGGYNERSRDHGHVDGHGNQRHQ